MRDARRLPGLICAALVAASALVVPACVSASASASTVYAWGENEFGQLGLPAPASSPVPLELPLAGVNQVAAGGHSSYGVSERGEVSAWGSNGTGALGEAQGFGRAFSGVLVPGLIGLQVKEVSAGHGYALALLTDGTVLAWGDNKYGQLGDGTTEQRNEPVVVLGLQGVRTVVASFFTSYAILEDGQLVAWGNGRYGQLGLGDTSDRLLPTQVPGMEHVAQVSGGCIHTVVLTDAGTVETSGGNEYAQLGHGAKNTERSNRFAPVQAMPTESIREVQAGLFYDLALTNSGKVFTWGYDHAGQLGTGMTYSTPQGTPRAVVGLPGPVVKLAGASGAMNLTRTSQHTLALIADGSVVAWGGNEYGQLGVGYASPYVAVPTQVVGLTGGVTDIASGGFASLAVRG